jgi:peptidoglycan/LPS O-acetylase OafA/YrhL
MLPIKYSPALDGLRAICIVFTLFNHIEGVPKYILGSVGVDIFFPLSGFLITGLLLDDDWRDLRGYYVRRFFRIVPVYYLSLLLTALFTVIGHKFGIGESKKSQLEIIIIPSILFSREIVESSTLFGQAWTVGIEEKFYIVWPLLFMAMNRIRFQVLFLFVFLVGTLFLENEYFIRGYGGIALGCISALVFFKYGKAVATKYSIALFAMAYYFCYASNFHWRNLAISFAAAVWLPSLYCGKSVAAQLLAIRPIAFLGKLTFSIYMFHVLIFFVVKIVLKYFSIDHWFFVFISGYIFSVVFSYFVFTLYEKPLIDRGKAISAAL